MQQSPSWEASFRSASEQIPYLLWTQTFITMFTKRPPLFPVLSHMWSTSPHTSTLFP